MKKIVSVLLIVLMIFTLSACSSNTKELTESTPPENPVSTNSEQENGSALSTDVGLLNVEVNLPAEFFKDVDMSTFDTESYIKENNFKKAVFNEDGSMTVTMSKSRHNEMLNEMKASIQDTFDGLVEGVDTPYIKAITYEDNYKIVTVDVIKADYESVFDMTPLQLYISTFFYQTLSSIEPHCEVIIRDVDTKETINSVVYPDALKASN
jgi:hypothetical protein